MASQPGSTPRASGSAITSSSESTVEDAGAGPGLATIAVHLLELQLRVPFTTSFGTYRTLTRPFVVLRAEDGTRGVGDVGWYLKLLQGYEALRAGHTAAAWTFDPMRGANARLNLEKLGARASEFTIDKYGVLPSALYGAGVPSDRLTVRWDLTAPATADRIARVFAGRYHGPTPDGVAGIPEATALALDDVLASRPLRLRYRIPGDVDRLMRDDPGAAIRWRREMRTVLSAWLTTKSARVEDAARDGPVAVGVQERTGEYVVDGFATGFDAAGERVSYYLLGRIDG